MDAPSRSVVLLPLFGIVAGCQLWVDEYKADLDDPVDSSHLCAIEHATSEVKLDATSLDHYDTLEEYYAEANPELMKRFDEVADAYADGRTVTSVTYLTGEAGAGKSFVISHLTGGFTEDQACDLSLAKVLAKPSEQFPTTLRPDLATLDGTVVINELPGFVDPDAFSLAQFLEAQGCSSPVGEQPLVILDGIDEIHPDSARVVLRAVEDYASDEQPGFVHFVVSGRPEGFSPWFRDPMRTDLPKGVAELFRLNTPTYASKGDVTFRLTDYLAFSKQLVLFEEDGDLDAYVDSVWSHLERYPFLRYSLRNLSVGNVILQHTAPGSDAPESDLKRKLFLDLLARNSGTHGRPGTGSPYDASYQELLERLATTYVNVNDDGEFTVGPVDSLPLLDTSGTTLGEVLVSHVLERSGLAYLASPTSTTKRFRFSPLWVHGYLVERRNQRAAPKYTYDGCK